MIKALKRAHQTLREHNASPVGPLDKLQSALSPADFYTREMVKLAFLAPDIQAAILQGRPPAGLTLKKSWISRCRSIGELSARR